MAKVDLEVIACMSIAGMVAAVVFGFPRIEFLYSHATQGQAL